MSEEARALGPPDGKQLSKMRAQVWADPYGPAGDLAVEEGSMYDGGNNETRGTSQVTLQLRIIALLLVPLALVLLWRYELI